MRKSPLLSIRIGQKDACFLVLDRVKRMAGNNVLGKVVVFSKENVRQFSAVGLVQTVAHAVCCEKRSVLFEESLMVAKMVGIDFEIVAEIWNACWAGDFADGVTVDGDCDGLVRLKNFGDGVELAVIVNKTDAYRMLAGHFTSVTWSLPFGLTIAKCDATMLCSSSKSTFGGSSISRAVEAASPRRWNCFVDMVKSRK